MLLNASHRPIYYAYRKKLNALLIGYFQSKFQRSEKSGKFGTNNLKGEKALQLLEKINVRKHSKKQIK